MSVGITATSFRRPPDHLSPQPAGNIGRLPSWRVSISRRLIAPTRMPMTTPVTPSAAESSVAREWPASRWDDIRSVASLQEPGRCGACLRCVCGHAALVLSGLTRFGDAVDVPADHSAPSAGRQPASLGAARSLHRRRPTGAPPPLPHRLLVSGVGWLVAAAVLVGLAIVVFQDGVVRGPAVTVTVVDDAVVRWLAGLSTPGLTALWQALAHVGSLVTTTVLWFGLVMALLVLRHHQAGDDRSLRRPHPRQRNRHQGRDGPSVAAEHLGNSPKLSSPLNHDPRALVGVRPKVTVPAQRCPRGRMPKAVLDDLGADRRRRTGRTPHRTAAALLPR
jgi:hypothetical protein